MITTKEKYQRQSILDMASKYTFDEKHALFVENVSLNLFDSLAALWHFSHSERILLSHASLLHDIGNCISEEKHHKHTKYIIDNEEKLAGYPATERKLLSFIAYNHRKKVHKDVALLPRKEQELVLRLSAIIRVADSLDYAREDIMIKNISVEKPDIKITIEGVLPERLNSRLIRKKELFCKIFKLDIGLGI